MHEKHTIQNCMYKWYSWWWTHDVRNMYKTPRFELKQFEKVFMLLFYVIYTVLLGTAVAQWLRCCATNPEVAGSIPAGVIGIFHWPKFLPIALWPRDRLNLEQKWVPGAFPGSKGGRCVRLTTLPPFCAVVMKSGNLNFLESSEPLQACNGTALPFYIMLLNLFGPLHINLPSVPMSPKWSLSIRFSNQGPAVILYTRTAVLLKPCV